MWKAFYKDMDYTELPIFALLLFFGVFLVVLVWVSVFRRAQDFDNSHASRTKTSRSRLAVSDLRQKGDTR